MQCPRCWAKKDALLKGRKEWLDKQYGKENSEDFLRKVKDVEESNRETERYFHRDKITLKEDFQSEGHGLLENALDDSGDYTTGPAIRKITYTSHCPQCGDHFRAVLFIEYKISSGREPHTEDHEAAIKSDKLKEVRDNGI